MTQPRFLVLDAAGPLGRRAVDLLVAHGAAAVIAATRSRDPIAPGPQGRDVEARSVDFEDPYGLVDAFRGAARALVVGADGFGPTGFGGVREARVIRALEDAGVGHVVYVSAPNAYRAVDSDSRAHAEMQTALATSTLDFTILNRYPCIDDLLPQLRRAVDTGVLLDSGHDAPVAYVTREDCARTAVAALSDVRAGGRRTFEITGPGPLTGDDLARVLAEVSGQAIERYGVPAEMLDLSLSDEGVSQAAASAWAGVELAARRGEFAQATDAVATLTGRAPQCLHAFLVAHREHLCR